MKPKQSLVKTGWKSFETAITKKPEEVISMVKNSGLTGRGGAHFSTGMKWEFTSKAEGSEKYLICNADEGEPGTFKDRLIIKKNPETLIEGIAIASYAVGAKKAYIYLRGEYDYLKKKLQKAIDESKLHTEKIGLTVSIVTGAGAYICGDETAIMNSIKGLRGEPRVKPPFPAQKGLWQSPTCINNVETLANVPLLFNEGWKKELRLFSISGNIKKPGVYEFPLGITIGKILKKVKPTEKIKAFYFGCAGGCVPADEKTKLDVETIKSTGAMLGSCTLVLVGENHSIPSVSQNIAEFFVHESCGKCTPCREANPRILEILQKINSGKGKKEDIQLLDELADFVTNASLCGLGQSCATHIKTELKYFRDEFEKRCE